MDNKQLKVAVHKFSSCEGCQIAFLNLEKKLLVLSDLINIVHFAEAGFLDEEALVDIAFIEGSISTEHELNRIKKIRENSNYLITIGACATAGGLQALRNFVNTKTWIEGIYATPQYISTLETSTPISSHVKVDLELWGCPISEKQLLYVIRTLLFKVDPFISHESICLECKRKGNICVLITRDAACMGPVTKTGCGAICPSLGRDCYGCFGPSENPNAKSLGRRFEGFGLIPDEISKRFRMINSESKEFKEAGEYFK